MKRELVTFSVATLIAMAQWLPATAAPTVLPFQFEHGGYISQVSYNGLWAVGVPRADETFGKTQIVDVKAGKIIDLPVEMIIDDEGFEDDPSSNDLVYTACVSEDGKIIGGSYNGQPGFWKDNAWHLLEYPDGRFEEYQNLNCDVLAVRGNGKYMVGHAYDKAYNIKPILWEDGKIVKLENLPEEDWKGHRLDAKEDAANMSFFDVTEDGRYLLAGMSTNHPGWGCCFFLYDRSNSSWKFIGVDELNERIDKGEIHEASELSGDTHPQFSANGKWIVGNVLLNYIDSSSFGVDKTYPYRYNIETGEFKIYEDDNSAGIGVTGVTNDGQLVGMNPISSPSRNVVFHNDNGLWYTLENILTQGYGIDFVKATGYDTLSGTSFGINAEGNLIVAMTPGTNNDSYMVELDDCTFFEATKKVNQLHRYSVLPQEGSKIAFFNNFYVQFEYPCEPVEGAYAEIRDAAGNAIAKSTGVKSYNNDARIYNFTFDDVPFQEGTNYTVVIPDNQFVIENIGDKNREISASYVGRASEPLKVVNASPKEFSAINELGMNSVISLSFDGTVQTVSGKYAELYQEGLDTPITQLVLSASGNQILIYPAASRKLMQGTNYIVKVPAGAIVDVTGFCGNEAFELNYAGAYVLPTPEPGSTYLFIDNFDDPNQSLSNFMQYEGDHNAPNTEMSGFGFDTDNTPWNFSIRESSSSSDYCAASHSMYTNKGQSDDWMVLPQLDIEEGSEFYTLNFKGQSYRKSANDKLTVIAWECDDVFNSLDRATINKIKEEGKVIFEEQLLPGESEENLDGDWVDYTVSLDEFKGKKIYVAFLNRNENQSVIFVDNINVLKEGNFKAEFIMENSVYGVDNVAVTAFVNVTRDMNYDSIKATLHDNDGKAVSTYEASGLNLKKGDSHRFTFPQNLPLTVGRINNYSMDVELGGETQTMKSTIGALAFLPNKVVVLEEGTGSWCANCPKGIVAIEEIERRYPNNFVSIAVHNADAYAYPEYESFLGFKAFPTGRVNRNEKMLQALAVLDGNYAFGLPEDSLDRYSFLDAVLEELKENTIAEIKIDEASFNGYNIDVKANVRFAIEAKNVNYNVCTVLLEDQLFGIQQSNVAQDPNPIFGEWGGDGIYSQPYVPYYYKDVARTVAGGLYNGENGFVPTTVAANENYEAEIYLELPEFDVKLENCKVVCMLIDASNGKIVNAAKIDSITRNDMDGVDEIGADVVKVNVSCVNGTVYLNGAADGVEVYTLQGARVNNVNLANGLYVVRGIADGKAVTAKVLVK